MERPAIIAAIGQADIFSGLAPAVVDVLAANAAAASFPAGVMLWHQGESARDFYLLLEGSVRIEIPAIQGPALELQAVEAGQVMGWSWLIPPYRWSFNAEALTDIRAIRFDGAAILARSEADPAFGYALLRRFSALMSDRLAHARQRMIDEWQMAGFA